MLSDRGLGVGQRSPAVSDVSECYLGTSTNSPRPTRAVEPQKMELNSDTLMRKVE